MAILIIVQVQLCRLFMNTKDYELIYVGREGAEVWAHPLHLGVERAANLAVAVFLCDAKNETTYLLPASTEPNSKNPDALVNDELWEFKTNYEATGTSIDSSIRKAHQQAPNVVLHLTTAMNTKDLENAIYGRVRKCQNLKKLRVMAGSKLYEFSREEIMEQYFRGVMEAF